MLIIKYYHNKEIIMAKKISDPVAKFVTGSPQTKAPKPKSLTPKTNSTKSGDKKRAGVGGKSVPY
jgi:hypothetical protein